MRAGDGKDPSEVLPSLGPCTHAYPHGRSGLWELEAPGMLILSGDHFRNLYRIAHSERAVEKWDNFAFRLSVNHQPAPRASHAI